MGCGCKANQQISFLQKKYGNNIPSSKTTKIRETASNAIKNVLLAVMMIPIVPIVFVGLVVRNFFTKKPINIKNTFKIKN